MPKTVNIYNQVGIYAGSCPATGYHFLNFDGALNNNYNQIDGNTSLVFPLNRITSASYSISAPRTSVRSLGKNSNLANPIINPPEITLNFDYYLMGLINEARLGFYVNHLSGDQTTGKPLYSTRVCPISGFIDRSYNRTNDTEQGWPLTTRDGRNIFIGIKKDTNDFNDISANPIVKSNQINVLAFGDCFLNNYITSASVGDIPRASVQFSVGNIEYYNDGSGQSIPSCDTKTYEIYSGIKFNIPSTYQGRNLPTVLLPGDITLDIKNSSNQYPENLSIDLNDVKIQNYTVDLNLNRESLYGLGYKLPLDKRVNFPVFANLGFNMFVGDDKTGSLVRLIKNDENYNITIKLRFQRNQLFTGTAIQYEFLGAKFNALSFEQSIGSKKSANLSFITEIDPVSNVSGFFISGHLGIPHSGQDLVYLSEYFDGDTVLDRIEINSSLDLLTLYNNSRKVLY